ncbi:MAG: hypothetical protein HYX99_01580 [Chloroflexi bacterium]|nr:hypothetical protein [Chloroflexota bacterium]
MASRLWKWMPLQALSGRRQEQQLPTELASRLREKFSLTPEQLAGLGYVGRGGTFAGAPVRFLRVYDQAEARAKGLRIGDYGTLDQHRELVLYEGHIFRDGLVHLAPAGQAASASPSPHQ